MSVSLALLP